MHKCARYKYQNACCVRGAKAALSRELDWGAPEDGWRYVSTPELLAMLGRHHDYTQASMYGKAMAELNGHRLKIVRGINLTFAPPIASKKLRA